MRILFPTISGIQRGDILLGERLLFLLLIGGNNNIGTPLDVSLVQSHAMCGYIPPRSAYTLCFFSNLAFDSKPRILLSASCSMSRYDIP